MVNQLFIAQELYLLYFPKEMAVMIAMSHVIPEDASIVTLMHAVIYKGQIVADDSPARILPNFFAYFAFPQHTGDLYFFIDAFREAELSPQSIL
ncbi:MAG TPA: hypothetical protein VG168_04990 [Bryobacteraceae bacterium]|nr:hypothetical protein [Bryobacteraceae bacterium]